MFFRHVLTHPYRIKSVIFFHLLLCVTLSPYAVAQTDKLTAYLPQDCYHAGQYQQQKVMSGVGKTLTTEGSFIFNCEQGLIWHTQTPIAETIVYNIQGNHFLVRADGSKHALNTRVHRSLGKILTNLMGGDEAFLRKTFLITEQQNELHLAPKNKQMKAFLHALTIVKQNETLHISLQLAEQDSITIVISGAQRFATFNQTECLTIAHHFSQACHILFQGVK